MSVKLTELAIFTDAVAETTAFYQRLLGCAPVHQEEGFALFQSDGFQVVIHRTYSADESELPGESHAGFTVPDLDAAVRDLQSAGFTVQHPPRDYDWGRSAYLRDPAGNLVELNGQK
jgi:catechol 2,3-dioxygenase-like lactoylglutathione lyase family enzyme